MQRLYKPFFQKLIFCLLILVCIPTFSKAQDFIEHIDENETVPSYLQANRILKRTTYSYTAKGDSTFVDSARYQYDDHGNMISLEEYNMVYISNPKRLQKSTTLYTYTATDKLAKEVHYYNFFKDQLGRSKLTFEFQYDSTGRHSYTVFYNKDTSSLKIYRKVYNSIGKLIEVHLRIDNNKEVLRNKLAYDLEGRMQQLEIYDGKGEDPYYYKIAYNQLENTRTTYRFYKTEKQFSEKITYNLMGQPLSIAIVDTGTLSDITGIDPRIQKFVYNKDGTLNTIISYKNGKVITISKSFYIK